MDNTNSADSDKFVGQVKAYIQQQMQSGLSPNEIQVQLKKAGWSDDIIQRSFKATQAEVMPNQPGAKTPGMTAQPAANPSASVQTQKRGRIKTGWLLFKESVKVLKSDKMLSRYVLMNAIVSIILTIIYGLIILFGHSAFLQKTVSSNGTDSYGLSPVGYIPTFIFYLLSFFVFNYYMAGLAANVLDIFKGNKKSYGEYMKASRSKAGPLFMFSLIEATVGVILRVIAERSRLIGRIISSLLGAAWSIARLFVLPIIVSSDEGAVPAIKDSVRLLISTWGENIVGRVSLGGVVFLIDLFIMIPLAIILAVLGAAVGHAAGVFIGLMLFVIIFILFSLIVATASNILNTTLFYYAKFKQIPPVFDAELLNSVFIHKKQRKNLLS